MERLSQWRERIDDVDQQLVDLLNERVRIALEIGRTKTAHQRRIYDPAREELVIQKAIAACNGGPLRGGAVRRLFERIIEETRDAQRDERNLEASPAAAYSSTR